MNNSTKWTFAIIAAALTLAVMGSCNLQPKELNNPETPKAVELIPGTHMLIRLDPLENGGRSLKDNTAVQYGVFSINHVSDASLGFDLTLLDADGMFLDTTSHILDRLNQPLNMDGVTLPVYTDTFDTLDWNNAYKLSLLREMDGGVSDWKFGGMDTFPGDSEGGAENGSIKDRLNGGGIESYDAALIIIIIIVLLSEY